MPSYPLLQLGLAQDGQFNKQKLIINSMMSQLPSCASDAALDAESWFAKKKTVIGAYLCTH